MDPFSLKVLRYLWCWIVEIFTTPKNKKQKKQKKEEEKEKHVRDGRF